MCKHEVFFFFVTSTKKRIMDLILTQYFTSQFHRGTDISCILVNYCWTNLGMSYGADNTEAAKASTAP